MSSYDIRPALRVDRLFQLLLATLADMAIEALENSSWQNMQNKQNMQNMQNISPLLFLSKDQKSKISESESSINSRTCLGHLVLFVLLVTIFLY